MANDQYSLEAAKAYASYPTKNSVQEDQSLKSDPVLSVIAPRIKKLIWPGPFPATMETSAKKAAEEVLYNGVDLDSALENAQRQMERDMRNESFKSLESAYQ